MKMTHALWVLSALLLSNSCGRNEELKRIEERRELLRVFDQFSQSYRSFDVQAPLTEGSMVVEFGLPPCTTPARPEIPCSEYRKHMTKALSATSSAARVREASAAVTAYETEVAEGLKAEYLERLDQTVLKLIEQANTFPNGEYRQAAIEVAKCARETHSSMEATRRLWERLFSAQMRVLRAIVDNNGDMVRVWASSPLKQQEFGNFNKELENHRAATKTAHQKYRDAFAALQGRVARR